MSDDGFSTARAQSDAGEELQPLTLTPQLIAAAVSLLGSPAEVRAHMRSSEERFLDYCAGAKEPSFAELDRLITLIVREQGRLIAQNRNLLRQVRDKTGKP